MNIEDIMIKINYGKSKDIGEKKWGKKIIDGSFRGKVKLRVKDDGKKKKRGGGII